MNYEEKYKDAQKWVESIYTELSHERQMEAEAFFPELAESEDDRIRKALLEYFGEQCDTSDWNGIYGYEVYAWLEKQGQACKSNIWHDISEEPNEDEELLCEWESEDHIWHDTAFYHPNTKTFYGEKQVENVTRWCYITDLLEWQCHVKESANSRQEIKICEETDDSLTDKKEQKPIWKEEDEYQFNTILHGLDLKKEIHKAEGDKAEEDRYNTQYNWLKSLKGRLQSLNSWKPHIAQIEAFEHFYRSMGESGFLSPYDSNTQLLYSLLLELRKLKK